jgi:peptidoglycan-associated lipoprotein
MRTHHLSIAMALAAAAVGCHPTPDVAVNPVADTLALAERARQDSIARADALARARADSERADAQRRADSVAALQTTRQMEQILTTMVHFDYDRSVIRPGDAQVLDLKIPVLQANKDVRIQVAGNCDERGSDEYNLALGNRRAIAAKAYLAAHGVDGERIETITYGEERPVDPRHTATAYAMNRNAQFSLLTPSVVLRLP